jgi:predicted methyltransferase
MHLVLATILTLTSCIKSPPTEAPPVVEARAGLVITPLAKAVVAASDRTDEDRALDGGRHPEALLSYFEIEPGMRIGDMFSGGGYTVELLARAVGDAGAVYGVNSPFFLERFAEGPWSTRLERPVNANVSRLDREFDNQLPEDVRNLDRVFSVLVYHDFVWQGTDRAAMNQNIFEALRPGGIYAIVDHSAAEGAAGTVTETLHRVEQSLVRAEIEAAGFAYVGEADFLRAPDDTRDWSASPRAAGDRRGTRDRFVMSFVKPADAAP